MGGILYGKDRLTKPLLKVGKGYKAISWEEAIKVIADRVYERRRLNVLRFMGSWSVDDT